MKKVIVLGAGGFIGGHLVTHLKSLGYWVRGVDQKTHEYKKNDADEFIIADLREYSSVNLVIDNTFDEVYQLAADMGGAEFVFSGINDADIIHNSAMINLHVCDICVKKNIKKIFYSSSACIYPEHNQMDPNNPNCEESTAYPANPDSDYGWEKLLSERIYLAYKRNKNLNVKIARFHNIFGPLGTWNGGREKAPAAICRKVIMSNDKIDIFGNGCQTRSFLYIDECIEGIRRLMESDFNKPINLGSSEVISINDFAKMIISISNKKIKINNIDVKQIGVRGRNSDNTLIKEVLKWSPTQSLYDGIKNTYEWISTQLNP